MPRIPRVVAAWLLLAGCAHTAEPVAAAPASAQMPMESCPMMVEGAHVSVEDTEGGVALVFTTDTGDVAELRERVQRMAAMHEQHMGEGAMAHEHMHDGRAQMDTMPAADVQVSSVERGARVDLTPRDPTQLASLREHARMHAEQMNSGSCPMMQMEHRMPS